MFVGQERVQAVDTLVGWFDAVQRDRRPRLLCATGGPGLGKTRLLQETYSSLARSHQTFPGYWPPSLTGDRHLGVMAERKIIAPPASFTIPAGAEIPWFWWGISCQRDLSGTPMQSVRLASGQFEVHLRYLSTAASERSEQWQRWSNNLASALDVLGVLNPLAAIPDLAGAGAKGLRSFGGRRRRAKEIRTDRRIDASAAALSEVDLLAESLALVAADGLPIVIAVDDAHWADQTTLRFLTSLLQHDDTPILVIATAWDHEVGRQTESRIDGSFGLWLEAAIAAGTASSWEVSRLGDTDLEAIVREAAPRTPTGTVQAIAGAADGNPLVLSLLLELDVVRRDIAPDGSIDMNPSDLRLMPSDLQGLYQELWRDLPEDVRTGLVLAALQGPTFIPEAVNEVAIELGVYPAADGLARAASLFQWVTVHADGLAEFAENPRFETAADRQAETFSDDDLDRARVTLLTYLIRRRASEGWAASSAASRMVVLRKIVELTDSGRDLDSSVADAVIVELLDLVPDGDADERIQLRKALVEVRSGDGGDAEVEARSGLLDELAGISDADTIRRHADALAEVVADSADDLETVSVLTDLLDETEPQALAVDEIGEYRAWEPITVASLTELAPSEIAELIRSVVETEGPIKVERVNRLLVGASPANREGHNIRAALERGLKSATRRGFVIGVVGDTSRGNQWSIRLPSQPDVRLRQIGPRSIDDVPASELLGVGRSLLASNPSYETLRRAVLQFCGVSRLTERIGQLLDQALRPLKAEFEEDGQGITNRSDRSLGAVIGLADRYGSGEVFDDLLLLADCLELYCRPYTSSLVFTADTDRKRTLVHLAPLTGARVAIGYRNESWQRAYDVDADRVEAYLGEPWVEVGASGAYEFMANLAGLMNEIWSDLAEINSHLVVISTLDGNQPTLNKLFWSQSEEPALEDFEGIWRLFGDLDEEEDNSCVAVAFLGVPNGFDAIELIDIRANGGTTEEREAWIRTCREDPTAMFTVVPSRSDVDDDQID